MKITKNSFSEKNFKKTIDLVQLDLVQNRKICGDTGNLRVEYQPQMITEIFARTHASEASSGKIHIGCGGGKTTIVLAAMCLAIEHGFAKKLVVTAPTIALTVQIQEAFEKMWKCFASTGINVECVNVSSYSERKNKTHAAQAEEEKADDVDQASMKKIKTIFNPTEIREAIENDHVTVFFVCKPSFLNKFCGDTVFTYNLNVDFTWHDEYHNLISQAPNDKTFSILEKYADHSRVNVFASASKKIGGLRNSNNAIFGTTIFRDVPTKELVQLGYLKKNLRIFLVTPKHIKRAPKAIRELLAQNGIEDAASYQYEATATYQVFDWMHSVIGRQPKMITFSKRVAHIEEMFGNKKFVSEFAKIDSGVELHKLNSKMTTKDCEQALKEFAQATGSSLLLQHSKVGEGTDVPTLNTAFVARGMGDIALQQALGRIQRRNYADDSDDTAYLWILVDEEDSANHMRNLAETIHYITNGLDVFVEAIGEQKGGGDTDNGQKKVDLRPIQWGVHDLSILECEYSESSRKLREEMARITIEQVNEAVKEAEYEAHQQFIDGDDSDGAWQALMGA